MPPAKKKQTHANSKSKDLTELTAVSDHLSSCMCKHMNAENDDITIKPHSGWYDYVDFDPATDVESVLKEKPYMEWTQVARGKVMEGKSLLSECRAYVSDESLRGFWTGLIVWKCDKRGYVHCPFPGCRINVSGAGATHTLMCCHWKRQHAHPFMCKLCGASYTSEGALKVHYFRTRHSREATEKLRGAAQSNLSVYRKDAITRYIHEAHKLMELIRH